MRVRLKKDITISLFGKNDNYDVFYLQKGLMGTVLECGEIRRRSRNNDDETENYYKVKWDGFANPRVNDLMYSQKSIEVVDLGVNKKGWKI